MKNLYDPAAVREIKDRLSKLRTDSPRQWGKMDPAQAVAHCAGGLEWAVGDTRPERMFVGRVLGAIIKPLLLRDDKPMRPNSPTVPSLVVESKCDLAKERERLGLLIDRFAKSGEKGCTENPHPFFGRMKPEQWAILMYKHLDHHLRQFGA